MLDPRMDNDLQAFFTVVTWTVWVAFAADLAIRLALVPRGHRAEYAIRHWYDVALVVVPMLRPLRMLRLLALVRILDRSAANSLAGRVLVYVSGAAAVSVGLGALAVLDAEQDATGANITTFGDAVWWACTTVTTVGYGDHFPVTLEGRVVAVVLMVVGIGLVGAVTASVATWLIGRAQAERESSLD
ncbi:potassium channel family protein [Aeromicrobium sp. JJY06]|uniref:potassium channel family protein n=1 Tax=Aeromicrobium sp. JJY06 TaxID=3373478 RepID=UPI00376EE4B8